MFGSGSFFEFWMSCRLWQDAENRVYLIKELDRLTGLVGNSVWPLMLLNYLWNLATIEHLHFLLYLY